MVVRIELKRVFIFETIKMHKTLLFKNCKISYNTKETFGIYRSGVKNM